MRTFTMVGVVAMALTGVTLAQDAPKPSTPQTGHAWLKQLEGEWVCESEGVIDPTKPPVKCKGTESVRSLGGLWAVSETKAEFMGTPVTGIMTIGFDTKKQKYVGTWICSMDGAMFKYEGALDAAGKVLTLETEGPHMTTGKTVKMKDVIELKDKDTKLMTSFMQGDDGKWVQFMTMTAKRKK